MVAATASLAIPYVARSAEELNARPGQKPKFIIHLVSDGMSAGTLSCADQFSFALRKRGLSWLKLYERPDMHMGLMNMRSLTFQHSGIRSLEFT